MRPVSTSPARTATVNLNVYVLDDRGVDEIRTAAALWGAHYLARPERGWMKKAGNLATGTPSRRAS